MTKQDVLNTLKEFQQQQANNKKMVDCITLAYLVLSKYDEDTPTDENAMCEIVKDFFFN